MGEVAADLAGERIIWSTHNPATGIRRVYTGTADGSETNLVFSFLEAGPLFMPPFVDISPDGVHILFSRGQDEIYLANFEGGNARIVVDSIRDPGNSDRFFQVALLSAPQFGGSLADPLNIYFIHTDFNPGGTRRAGLYFVSVDGTTSIPTQIFSARDVANLYGDSTTYTPVRGLFGPKVSDGNLILFGTADFNTGSSSHLWTNLNTTFSRVTENGPRPAARQAMDISGNGRIVTWFDEGNDQFVIKDLDENTLETYAREDLGFDFFASLVSWVSTNYSGDNTLLSTTSSTPASGSDCVLINSVGEIRYPLFMAKIGNGFSGLGSTTLAKSADRFFYRSADAEENIWMTGYGTSAPQSNKQPEIEEFAFSKNWVLEGRGTTEMTIKVKDTTGIFWIPFVELDGQNRPFAFLNTFPTSFLVNDGSTVGDELIDDVFTRNNVREQSAASAPDTFTVRFNLFTDGYVSSYEIYPFFLLTDDLVSVYDTDRRLQSVRFFPNPASTTIRVENQESLGIDPRVLFTAANGVTTDRMIDVDQTIDVSSLSPGRYTMRIVVDGESYVKNVVVLR